MVRGSAPDRPARDPGGTPSLSLISPKFLPLLYTSDDKAFLIWYPIAAGLITAIFLPVALFTWLPTYRVLMAWVYDHTESIFLGILMSASLLAFWISFTPQAALAGNLLAIYYIVFTAAMWVVIAVVLRSQTLPRPERGVPPVGISTQKRASS